MQGKSTALRRLMTELRDLSVGAPDCIAASPISESDYYNGPDDTPYACGVFVAVLEFPRDYPLSPPSMRFTSEIYHPNVYPDGRVCISILHAPGDDPNHYEHASERWSPVQSIEKILLSVLSMLAEPNDESGANLDACKVWRDDRARFNKIVDGCVRRSIGM